MFESMVVPCGKGNPRNSEASAVALESGDILLAFTDFYGEGGGDHDPARISGLLSSDLGRTWGDRFTLQETIGRMNVMSASLVRLRSGEIAFTYALKNSTCDVRPFIRRSADEGRTWSKAVAVVEDYGFSELDNDRLVQMNSGRLLAPVSWSAEVSLGGYVSRCYFSDDEGRTWQRGSGVISVPGTGGADEPAVVELQDGGVLMLFRTALGHIWASRSEDGGETWGEAYSVKQLISPCAPVNVRRIPSTGDLLVVWNHHPLSERSADLAVVTSSERTPLTSAISRDDGESWDSFRDLETDLQAGFAYPSILFVGEELLLTYYYHDVTGLRQRGLSLKLKIVPIGWLYAAVGD